MKIDQQRDDSLSNHSEVLDLSQAPSILFLFGLAGSGKSYVGDLIGELCQWHVYHADDDLTDEMLQALENHQPFTPIMRDVFFEKISKKILLLQRQHARLVVTQAAYKKIHRQFLLSTIPGLALIMVDTSDELIEERIAQRSDGISTLSAAALRRDFESPDDNVVILENNHGKENIIRQLNELYRRKTL